MTPRSALMKQLEEVGVPRDRPVAVHTSLRAVGETEGGGEGFLDALISWVTKDGSPDGGLLCVPTHTWDALGGGDPVTMDMNSERTCVGTLPTLALRRILARPDKPDGVRTLHNGVGVAAGGDPGGGILVGHVVGIELIEEVDGLAGVVIVQSDEGIGIREPAPVSALVDMVKGPELLIRDGTEVEVVEDVPARPDGKAEVLMLIAALVASPQLLGLGDEALAEPGGIVKI